MFPRIVKKHLLPVLLVAGLATTAHADTYNGNGNTGFNGAVGNGTLSVTSNASGAYIFSFTLAVAQTNFGGNDLVIYIDNGKGNGIGTSTAGLTDVGDGGRKATSGFTTTDNAGGTGRSTLTFGALMSPQVALDISVNNANVYGLVNGNSFSFNGGQTLSGASQMGVTFANTTVSGRTVLTETVPATALGLTANAAANLKLVAIQVSETGFSSNEATVGLTGASGFGGTQVIGSVNTFAVPEPGTWGMLLLGIGGLVMIQRRRSFAS